MIDGKLVWLQEEVPNEDSSIALIIWEQLGTSVLFKDILEAIGQCVDWNWNISLHLPRRMRFQSLFYYQQWSGTWRSRFKQKTNSVLFAC